MQGMSWQLLSGRKNLQQIETRWSRFTYLTKKQQYSAPNAKKCNRQHLDCAVARFFFENAIPFNVASSSSFADMKGESMSLRQHNSLECYKVPSRQKLSGKLLYDAYERVQASIRPLLATAAKFGSTITSIRWME